MKMLQLCSARSWWRHWKSEITQWIALVEQKFLVRFTSFAHRKLSNLNGQTFCRKVSPLTQIQLSISMLLVRFLMKQHCPIVQPTSGVTSQEELSLLYEEQGRLLRSAISNFPSEKVTCSVISNISQTECPDEASTIPWANTTYERMRALVACARDHTHLKDRSIDNETGSKKWRLGSEQEAKAPPSKIEYVHKMAGSAWMRAPDNDVAQIFSKFKWKAHLLPRFHLTELSNSGGKTAKRQVELTKLLKKKNTDQWPQVQSRHHQAA